MRLPDRRGFFQEYDRYSHFTCSPGTKVQILTLCAAFYLLYWYKSTNTDALRRITEKARALKIYNETHHSEAVSFIQVCKEYSY